jgi:hypothetical protein
MESGVVCMTEGLTIITFQSHQNWNLENIINVAKLPESDYIQFLQRLKQNEPTGTKRKSAAVWGSRFNPTYCGGVTATYLPRW